MKKKQSVIINKPSRMTPGRIIFFVTTLIHIGFIYFGYALSTRHIYDTQMLFVQDKSVQWVPGEGNIFLFWGIVIASLLAIVFTVIVLILAHKKKFGPSHYSFSTFLVLNFIPLTAIVLAAFITFDQLVGILIYTFLLVLLIFFRDK